jgi:hypothetical protein
MSDFLQEMFNAVSGEEFEERPVDIKEFVESEEFLSSKRQYKLSEYQYTLVRAMSQIYERSTLVALHGERKANEIWENQTYREIIMQLGKGSGKDFTSTIAVAYVVYLCLCLKNPTKYFNNDSIDIINVAINADQAQRVFFKNFMERIKSCPWFEGKYDDKRDSVEFIKNVNVYSGHSEREAYEGYNTLMIILDEISGFALTNTSGNQKAKTGPEIYDWARGSVTSRFSRLGKVVLLSFPRFNNDFIQQKYNEVIQEKEVIRRSATVKINPDLGPEYDESNLLTIEWDEDHILRYEYPYTFALKRPSWEVNPNKDLQDDYALDFYRNYADAMGRFACMPSDSTDDTFIRDKQAIDAAFISRNGVDQQGVFLNSFQPNSSMEYYIHVDLSKVHDRCAVAMAHVDKWVTHPGDNYGDGSPYVRVDALRYWEPSKDQPMNYKEVTDYILALKRRGFNIKRVTFDRWNSHDTLNFLKSKGLECDILSVADDHYNDFLSVLYDERLIGPKDEMLITELKELRYIKGKIDHPRTGYKDLSDATCGAIFNAVSLTTKPGNREIEVVSFKSIQKKLGFNEDERQGAVITPPKKQSMPADLRDHLREIRTDAIRII